VDSRQFARRLAGQAGVSLLEVVIATAILGTVGAAFLSAISTAVVSNGKLTQETTAVNLARTQMEDIKAQPFVDPPAYATVTPPTGYSVTVTSTTLVAGALEQITITVSGGSAMVTLTGYKVNVQ